MYHSRRKEDNCFQGRFYERLGKSDANNGSLVDFEIGFGVALFVTPREDNLQSPSVAVDRTVR